MPSKLDVMPPVINVVCDAFDETSFDKATEVPQRGRGGHPSGDARTANRYSLLAAVRSEQVKQDVPGWITEHIRLSTEDTIPCPALLINASCRDRMRRGHEIPVKDCCGYHGHHRIGDIRCNDAGRMTQGRHHLNGDQSGSPGRRTWRTMPANKTASIGYAISPVTRAYTIGKKKGSYARTPCTPIVTT